MLVYQVRYSLSENIGSLNPLSITAFLALFSFIAGFIILLMKKIKFRNIYLAIFMFNWLYLFIELFFFITLCIGLRHGITTSLTNKNFAAYDSIHGFNYIADSIRFTHIVNDSVVSDHTFNHNNRGYFFPKDYQYKKTGEKVKRIIVMGDSYTAAEFLDHPWTERVNQYLSEKESYNMHETEIYSFSKSGYGLMNWHSIFFRDIVPHYEFDALVLAIFDDDLDRDFEMIRGKGQNIYCGYSNQIPVDSTDMEKNYAPMMQAIASIVPEMEIDSIVHLIRNQNWKPGLQLYFPDLHFLNSYINQLLISPMQN